MNASKRTAILALSDGTIFRGKAFGAPARTTGELVFFTSPTGYQEVLSDPGASGQIVVFAYPELGNVGVSDGSRESDRIHAAGVVARHLAEAPSSHLAEASLESHLEEAGIPGIEGIDTRKLVRILRDGGSQWAVLSTEEGVIPEAMVAEAQALAEAPRAEGAGEVGCKTPYEVDAAGPQRFHVVAYDFGIKRSMIRHLTERGCKLTVVPASTPASQALAHEPDGIFLSSGPGRPDRAEEATATVREFLGKAPIFGICFGHQLLAQAAGGSTLRMSRGHHGSNHPVKDLATGRVAITAQAHRYTVDPKSLERAGAELTHVSLHDGGVEGFALPAARAFGVQFHPEAGPGPHDSLALFDRFTQLMEVAR